MTLSFVLLIHCSSCIMISAAAGSAVNCIVQDTRQDLMTLVDVVNPYVNFASEAALKGDMCLSWFAGCKGGRG